jgi:hypothetical protein
VRLLCCGKCARSDAQRDYKSKCGFGEHASVLFHLFNNIDEWVINFQQKKRQSPYCAVQTNNGAANEVALSETTQRKIKSGHSRIQNQPLGVKSGQYRGAMRTYSEHHESRKLPFDGIALSGKGRSHP